MDEAFFQDETFIHDRAIKNRDHERSVAVPLVLIIPRSEAADEHDGFYRAKIFT